MSRLQLFFLFSFFLLCFQTSSDLMLLSCLWNISIRGQTAFRPTWRFRCEPPCTHNPDHQPWRLITASSYNSRGLSSKHLTGMAVPYHDATTLVCRAHFVGIKLFSLQLHTRRTVTLQPQANVLSRSLFPAPSQRKPPRQRN